MKRVRTKLQVRISHVLHQMTSALLEVSGTDLGDFADSADVAEPRLDITDAFRQDLSDGVPTLLYAIYFPLGHDGGRRDKSECDDDCL
jgi:hypothetical protein